MIYQTPPENFNPDCEVVGCYIDVMGEVLLLRRAAHKSEPGAWGLPAGKMEAGETPAEATVREVREESGIRLDINKLEFLNTVYVRTSEHDFVYHRFVSRFLKRPYVTISEEHTEYLWTTPEAMLDVKLVECLDECSRLYRGALGQDQEKAEEE